MCVACFFDRSQRLDQPNGQSGRALQPHDACSYSRRATTRGMADRVRSCSSCDEGGSGRSGTTASTANRIWQISQQPAMVEHSIKASFDCETGKEGSLHGRPTAS